MSIAGLVFIVFLVLKLIGVISWSWWWVTLPLWFGLAIAVVILLFAGGMLALGGFVRGGSWR